MSTSCPIPHCGGCDRCEDCTYPMCIHDDGDCDSARRTAFAMRARIPLVLPPFEQQQAAFIDEIKAALAKEQHAPALIDGFIAWALEHDYLGCRDNSYGCVEDAVADFENWCLIGASPAILAAAEAHYTDQCWRSECPSGATEYPHKYTSLCDDKGE